MRLFDWWTGESPAWAEIKGTFAPSRSPVVGMNLMALPKIAAILAELQDDPGFKALTNPPIDERALRFRQRVDFAQLLCLSDAETYEEMADRLAELHRLTVGPLAVCRAFIVQSQAVLLIP